MLNSSFFTLLCAPSFFGGSGGGGRVGRGPGHDPESHDWTTLLPLCVQPCGQEYWWDMKNWNDSWAHFWKTEDNQVSEIRAPASNSSYFSF